MANKPSEFIRTFGVNPEQLVGYAYTGFLGLACLAIVDRASVKSLSDAVGTGILVVIAIAAGIAGFTFYFRLVGELVLFPAQYVIHHVVDRLLGRTGDKHTATLSFLHSIGVPWLRCHAAYQELKLHFYPAEGRSQIQLAHGELHVLYVTATTLLGFAAYSGLQTMRFKAMLAAGLVALAAAFLADTIQQTVETHTLRSADRARLVEFLEQKGLITDSPARARSADVNASPHILLAHVGVVSGSSEVFESFWCNVVGLHRTWNSELPKEKALALFGEERTAKIVRYSGVGETQLEIHVPDRSTEMPKDGFFRSGLNHICLELTDRESFIAALPSNIMVHKYLNPAGWENVFMQDFEGNWVELRQTTLPSLPSLADPA